MGKTVSKHTIFWMEPPTAFLICCFVVQNSSFQKERQCRAGNSRWRNLVDWRYSIGIDLLDVHITSPLLSVV